MNHPLQTVTCYKLLFGDHRTLHCVDEIGKEEDDHEADDETVDEGESVMHNGIELPLPAEGPHLITSHQPHLLHCQSHSHHRFAHP